MTTGRQSYEFGPYRLLPSERLLLRNGEPVALAPKAFETLVALVRRAGRLAEKGDLLAEVWPDTFVEESNLTQNVFAVRRALGPGENGKPYIETVSKRGYRFVADVTVSDERLESPRAMEPAPAAPLPQRRWTRRALVIAALLVLLGAVAWLVFLSRPARHAPSFQTMTMTRLTTSGTVVNVAISPDGKYVAHAVRDGAQQSLWVRQAATQSNVQIVAPAAVGYVGLAFSAEGNFIYYTVASREFPQRAMFRVSALGGTPVKLLENLRGGAIAVSPDGRRLAFIRVAASGGTALMIADADGSSLRTLVDYTSPPLGMDAPAWSPDGQRIAFSVTDYRSNDTALREAHVGDGSTREVTGRRWLRIIKLAWLSDGRGLLALATPGDAFVYQVWHVPYPGGDAKRLTNDLNSYATMSLAAASDTLAVVQSETSANIWVMPDSDVSRMRAVTTGSGKTDSPTDWTPDGRIVYHSTASGTYDIWITGADGRAPQQLTSGARVNQGPAVSPDGRTIVFLSDRTGTPHLWRMNVDGSDQRQLTNGASGEQNPQFSPDGKWIVYRTALGRPAVWKMPAGGGPATQITSKISYAPAVSPDGKLIAFVYREEEGPHRIAVAPFDGGAPIATFELPSPAERPIRWTPDGRGIAYMDSRSGVSNIFAQPLEGGPPVPLTSFSADRIVGFAWSRDGRQLALSRGSSRADVVLITFR